MPQILLCSTRDRLALIGLMLLAACPGAAQTQQPHPLSPSDVRFPTLKSGDRSGTPSDNPTLRIDPNVPTSAFGGVVSLDIAPPGLGTFLASGALITPRHVLTAAHPLDADDDGQWQDNLFSASNVSVNLNFSSDLSTVVQASDIFFHPAFDGFFQSVHDDWAVVELAEAIDTIAGEGSGYRIPVYEVSRDLVFSGTTLTLAGYGQSGQGFLSTYPLLGLNSVKRTGANAADTFVSKDGDGPGGVSSSELWYYDFDGPTGSGPLGGPTLGNDIETVSGPGDSGGPAFISAPGGLRIAGNMTFLEGNSAYGSLAGGNLIHPYLDWLDGVVPGLTESTAVSADTVVDERRRFSDALSGLWFTNPEPGEAFAYRPADPGDRFAEVSGFAFEGIELRVGGLSLGVFGPGDSFSFIDAFGGLGVEGFTAIPTQGPLVTPAAFLRLEFSAGETSFDAYAVPIPTPRSLPVVLLMVGVIARRRGRSQPAQGASTSGSWAG